MTAPSLLDELEGVVLLQDERIKTVGVDAIARARIRAESAALRFVVTHHAEIAEAVRDAERWRALHWAEAPMVTVTGSQLARGIRPGDFSVPWDWPVTSKTRIRMIVMSNSAREDGE